MNSVSPRRLIIAAAFVAAGLALALSAGAPVAAALVALIAGLAAAALAWPGDGGPRSDDGQRAALSTLPDTARLLEAIDEPMLVVRDRRVIAANSAARAVLGDHIEGVDVRLAIRHPAAAEQLSAERPESSVTRADLIGLGERDRRWQMATSRMEDGSHLVRLTDRSAAHASEQMRVDFVANASHELRTPLATVLGFLETLRDDDQAAGDPATRGRFVDLMYAEARRIHRLVDDLISLSRIEAERFSPPRESVPLLPLVEEVRVGAGQLLEARGGRIEVVADAAQPVALGDRTQLLQLLQNLIVNAIKYGRAGETVTVRFEDAGAEMLRVTVIDRGEGIEPDHIPRLTERFYRVDPGRSRSMGGTGLGLAIVKHIVGRHRGQLDIRSTPGEGTQVSVLLPRAAGPGPMSSKSHVNVTQGTRNDPSEAPGMD
ncbi:ATP-binding protein [Allosphingosinicella indica]|uniref:histidine kinase n=1 Tax=Allosphingosinicella indica TaxID=941907 RepID=A0A1X7H0I3_9SPHN|nr:ATP-binding protein [Allosphingosinicella indica]SMF77682.1 two-component system, OmpR family, phosphate regulon sensor histidine kinase PhoR [Allosphingosinicella indica]